MKPYPLLAMAQFDLTHRLQWCGVEKVVIRPGRPSWKLYANKREKMAAQRQVCANGFASCSWTPLDALDLES